MEHMSNVEAEQRLLGTVMKFNEVLGDIPFLKPDDFYEPTNGRLFAKMLSLFRAGRAFDDADLATELAGDPGFVALGGPAYLFECARTQGTKPGAQGHATTIRECAVRRELVKIGGEMAAAASAPSDRPVAEIASDFSKAIAEAASVPASASGGRFALVPFADLKFECVSRYAVKGVLPAEGLVVVWGAPKTGKSFWTFDLAMHVALGWEYRGRRVTQGTVVYGLFEGQSAAQARAKAWSKNHLDDDPEAIPLQFLLMQIDLIRDAPALVDCIRSATGRPSVVVLDTLNRSFVGSESSDEDMSAYVRAADTIRMAFKCCVIVVHHCGHEGNRPRGHSALMGALDVQIKVAKDPEGDITTAEVELAKDGPAGASFVSRLQVVDLGSDQDGDPITSCIAVAAEPGARAKPSAERKLTSPQKIVMTALGNELDHGQTFPAPLLPGVAPSTRAVMLQAVRERAFSGGLVAEDETPNAQRTRWSRAVADLVALGRIRKEGDYVWLII